jgi:hypothetical protein
MTKKLISSLIICTILLTPVILWATYGEIQDDGNIEGLWHLNGSLLDATANNHDCSIYGTVTSTYDCIFDQCYNFAGASDELSCGNSLTIDTTLTVGVWIYATSDSKNDRIMGRHNNSPQYGWALMRYKTTDSILLGYSNLGTDWSQITSGTDTFELNQWYFIVLTYDGSNFRIYFNGEEDTSGDFPSAWTLNIHESTTANFEIGNVTNAGDSWTGRIDEVFIRTDVALTAAEIRAIYAMQKGMYGVIN